MRLVLDCNVPIGAGHADGACRQVVYAATTEHNVIISPPILAEYRKVVWRPKHAQRRALLLGLCERVERLVIPLETTLGLADPSDEMYLDAAVAGSADLLLTGNSRYFTAAAYGSVRVMSPGAFLRGEAFAPPGLTKQ